jgi:hypothetical protein
MNRKFSFTITAALCSLAVGILPAQSWSDLQVSFSHSQFTVERKKEHFVLTYKDQPILVKTLDQVKEIQIASQLPELLRKADRKEFDVFVMGYDSKGDLIQPGGLPVHRDSLVESRKNTFKFKIPGSGVMNQVRMLKVLDSKKELKKLNLCIFIVNATLSERPLLGVILIPLEDFFSARVEI